MDRLACQPDRIVLAGRTGRDFFVIWIEITS